jgi:hypothetical protein
MGNAGQTCPDTVIPMMEKNPESKKGNVKIDIPDSLNDPKYERPDVEHMTDEYRRSIGK